MWHVTEWSCVTGLHTWSWACKYKMQLSLCKQCVFPNCFFLSPYIPHLQLRTWWWEEEGGCSYFRMSFISACTECWGLFSVKCYFMSFVVPSLRIWYAFPFLGHMLLLSGDLVKKSDETPCACNMYLNLTLEGFYSLALRHHFLWLTAHILAWSWLTSFPVAGYDGDGGIGISSYKQGQTQDLERSRWVGFLRLDHPLESADIVRLGDLDRARL